MVKSFFEKLTGSSQSEDENYDYKEAVAETAEEVMDDSEYLDEGTKKGSEEKDADNDGVVEEEKEEEEEEEAPEESDAINTGEAVAELVSAKTRTSLRTKAPIALKHNAPRKVKEEIETTNLSLHEESEGQLAIDVYQTDDEIVIKSTIAGVDPKNIDVGITSDTVTIRGTRQKDERVSGENYFYQECYWGTFSRSVILPMEIDADSAVAGFKNGILTIRLPKIHKNKEKKLSIVEG